MNATHLFTLFRIPVGVTYGFWILLAYFGWRSWDLGPGFAVASGAAVLISLLVHEFGHGLVARRFGLQPKVVLHGFGGLCFHQPTAHRGRDAMIVAAGPLAGLALWLAFEGIGAFLLANNPELLVKQPLLRYFISTMIWINLVWSLLNLMPIWPLDGGHLFRLLMSRLIRNPLQALRVTHIAGVFVGGAGAVVAAGIYQQPMAAVFSGMFAFQNFGRLQALNQQANNHVVQARDDSSHELIAEITAALNDREWSLALRLAYRAKDDKHLSLAQMDQVWIALAVANEGVGNYEDALSYASRAPVTLGTFIVRVKALLALGRVEQARSAIGDPDRPELPGDMEQRLLAMVAAADTS